ncbi:MAG: type IX secretion system membrane protein PorP/SprF, partial [Bacteroidales bacterium]|nr:type IX secretion system membrane protein PorP/SprF [Bacteroidales bacterium]
FKFDIGINYMFQNKFLAALHYANKDALVLQLGYKYNKFQITYAFDIVTSRIRNVSSGAHEISLAAFIFQPNKEIKGNVPSF